MILGVISLVVGVVSAIGCFLGLANRDDLKEEIQTLWASESMALTETEYAAIEKVEEEYEKDIRNSTLLATASAFVCGASILTCGFQFLKHFNVI